MKPKLLVIELWGLGDLVIASPFLRAAAREFDVTLLAKPFAHDLQPRFWPEINVVPFNAPWTAFTKKYQVWQWPFGEMWRLRQTLAAKKFNIGLSARWSKMGGDPRDVMILKMVGATERIGFPHPGSRLFLTRSLTRPPADSHRYESWRVAGEALGIHLPPRHQLPVPSPKNQNTILLHSGARLPARVWPLENWRKLARHLRSKGYTAQIVCDPNQENWWKENGESNVACPRTVTELLSLIDRAGAMIANCSGPGHLAAACGVPTCTIFGPSLIEWFAPLHPQAEFIEGRPCPYKPCSDYCRFSKPFCIQDMSENIVWPRVEQFVQKHVEMALVAA